MKKTGKALIILFIICFLILICVGGAVAYAYFATDLLKSNKELFFKYLSQVVDEEKGFCDTSITNYFNKKEQTPYENSGNIKVNFQVPEGIISDNVIDSVNNLNITYSGQTDKSKSNAEQNIEIDFGQDIIIPINYRQNNQVYGLQSKYIGSKYIALENSNLKEFAEKLGMSFFEIPDSIDLEQNIAELKFTQEEKKQIIENYQKVLIEQIDQDKFTKSETQKGTTYTVTLSPEEVKKLLINFLETFKQDTLLINKFNQYLKSIKSTNQIEQENIQELMNELNQEDISKFKELKITIGQQNKILNQILIEYDGNKIELIKNISNDSINYVMKIQSRQQEGQVQISLSCTFSGISKLENINESYNLKIGMKNENETISYDYAINNNVKFKDSVSIESLNNDTALLLNDCDDTTLQNLMKAIIERIDSVNRYITSNLGLKESENPLIYSSPLTMLNTIIYNSASDSVSEVEDDLFEMEKQVHNDKFVRYEGTNKRSSQVNALIDTTLRNNLSESDYSKK